MYIVHVHIHVKSDQIEAFKLASQENASKSTVDESGVARFDVMQQVEDPTRFVLIEVYHTHEDAVIHKETQHYERWRKIAEPMMAEPRTRVIYANIFPGDTSYSLS